MTRNPPDERAWLAPETPLDVDSSFWMSEEESSAIEEENPFAQYMDWAEEQNALTQQEQKCRYAPTDDDIFVVDFDND